MKRIYHTWDKWECYPAGFYEEKPPEQGFISHQDAIYQYAGFLRDSPRFERALHGVITEWKHSCEHYLTNENMNRIAWLGQAAMCYATGVPARYRSGFNLLTEQEQRIANNLALKYLNIWLEQHGEQTMTPDEAASKTKANLY